MSKNKNDKEDLENLEKLRHSTAHLLAAAVLELHPDAKPTIGPATADGFYYDFEFVQAISENDLSEIEAKMNELVKDWQGFDRQEVSKEEALGIYEENPYKQELINEFSQEGQTITIYQSGDFKDLCRGGHVDNPAQELKHFKLLSVAGAYWRGDEKNTMLTRIYGTAFHSQEELEKYLHMLEEAKLRDHRKLGKELDLFVFSDLVGKGLPLFTPKGTMLREILNDFSQSLRLQKGYQKVWIPHITKKELYETSGHWDKFGDELFLVKSQETSDELVMKPMNCPHHQQIFASRQRSYRDLPIKYLETTTIYRDEKAGELLGLSRVRSVTQDDSHIFCTPDQIKEVYAECIKIIKDFYSAIDMKFKARLSFMDPEQPEKYLGDPDLWQQSQAILKEIADEQDLDYYEVEGEAAFYGPKIDFMVFDALGREWQLATPQLDFVQPRRFGLSYTDQDGEQHPPVMIHFALMGSLERFLSVYIEHTMGKFPVWLAPVQVKILPVSDKFSDYANEVLAELSKAGVRVELDDRSERLQAKIRDAQIEQVPYMLVVGGKEAENQTVAVRNRDKKEQEVISVKEFLELVANEVDQKL
jgi:threonyl-tRNA synthetase